jgi:hypothetical protein
VAQVSAAAATAVPPGEAFDPALYLGRLLDFHGSVELAALVDEPAPVPRSPASALRAGASSSQTPHSPPATVSNAEPALEGAVSDGHAALPERAARELKSSIATDFAAVRSQLGRAVARWTSPKSRVAGTLTLREALATRAALGTRERRTTTIAAAICAPLAEEARREIDATRSAARAIEGALLTELADRTERARRVASLASVVAQAMEPALRQRMHRLVDLVETRATELVAVAIESAPGGEPAILLTRVESAVTAAVRLFVRAIHASLESDERRVLGLVDGVSEKLVSGEVWAGEVWS